MGMLGQLALPFFSATALLIVKFLNVACIARIVSARTRLTAMPAFVGAWLLLIVFQTALMLALSAFGHLDRITFVTVWIACSALLFRTASAAPKFPVRPRAGGWNLLPLVAIVLIVGVLWLRAALFFDSTWDGQTYGLPRLIFWLHAKSVFIHMDTPQNNLFTNEWISELNMVAYALWCGDYLGFNFGNLEILIVFVGAIYWTARLLEIPETIALSVAAILVSAPAIVGLATVMKGDLLACAALCLAFAWLLQIKRGEQQQAAFFFLLLSLALAVSAKISTGLFAILFGIWGIAALDLKGGRDTYGSWLRVLALSILPVLLLLSRFWTNWLVYGNPVERVEGEKVVYALRNIAGNAEIALNQIFPWKVLWDDSEAWALTASMGLAVWLLLALAVLSLTLPLPEKSRRGTGTQDQLLPSSIVSGWRAMFVLSVLLTTSFCMGLGEPQPWTLRYFLPGILVAIVACSTPLARLLHCEYLLSFTSVASCLVVAANCVAVAKPGEVLPFPPDRIRAKVEAADTALKRAVIKMPFTFDSAGVSELGLDVSEGLRIAVYQRIGGALLAFMGSHAQNSISLTPDIDHLVRTASEGDWDAVVVSWLSKTRPADLRERLEALGYRVLVENELYVIALPLRRIEDGEVIELNDLVWDEKFGATAQTELTAIDHRPEVRAETFADTSLVSQSLSACGQASIDARVVGEVMSMGAHAAHLSIHSVAPLLVFPSGKYGAGRQFHSMAVLPCTPYRLSFGLGGWSSGKGQLRLDDLHIRFFRIKAPLSEADTGRLSVK